MMGFSHYSLEGPLKLARQVSPGLTESAQLRATISARSTTPLAVTHCCRTR